MRTRLAFYSRAFIAHMCIIGPLYFYPQLKQLLSIGLPLSALYFIAGALMFCSIIFFIFFNVDHLFFSYSMHQYRHGVYDQSKGFTQIQFLLWKALLWIFTLLFPLVYFVKAKEWPGAVALYIALFSLGFFLVNMEFLVVSYETYRQKRSVGRWGVGALRSRSQIN